MIKCPKCKKKIYTVRVYSECYQNAELDGNKITNYGSVEEVLETVGIECSNCGHDVSKLVK
jgi:hypothetical protein